MLAKIIEKSLEAAVLSAEEIAHLFQTPLFSRESALILSAAREKSEKASHGLAEVHAQVGLNIAPCPNNCLFCAFAAENRIFTRRFDLPTEKAVELAAGFERDGANAIYIMSTADYSNVIGTAAGANLVWAEAGSNPRDTEDSTENQRGMTVSDCIRIFKEGEWKVLEGPSVFYSEKPMLGPPAAACMKG